MELDAASRPELEQVERLGGADLVVGILDSEQVVEAGGAVAMVRAALAGLSHVARAVVVSNGGTQSTASAPPDGSGDGQSPAVFSCSLPAPGPAETPHQIAANAYRSVIAIGARLGVRACGVIASQPRAEAPQWISRLVQPALELGFDLVAPRYTRHRMEGLLNRSLLAPLYRALYGEQLENPMGPDFGLSGALLRRVLGPASNSRVEDPMHVVTSLASSASRFGHQVCESHLGVRVQRPTDWMNLSTLLVEVLGPAFLEMERQAAFWQSIRGSRAVPSFGAPEAVTEDTTTVDASRMLDSFHLGTQNLQDIWSLVLPPTTLLELRKLSSLPADQFRMNDELWARIVYDFALGHRLRTISRDHLLRSITPLYLGWIASYAREMEAAGPAEIESRAERLCKVYEACKPYLVSRWRWPDRFNP